MGIYYVAGVPYDSDYLMHYGIKGQKWGIRRFQNPDGTLTAAGKERYGHAYELELRKNSTKWENEFSNALMRNYDNKKVQKRIGDILGNGSQTSKNILLNAEEMQSQLKQLNNAFIEYSEKLEKERGKHWDGDGTEEHWELEKRYPEYRKISEAYEKAEKDAITAIKQGVKTGIFNTAFSDTKNLYLRHDYKDYKWTQINDGRWCLIGFYLNKKYGLDFFQEDFREARRLNKGKIGDLIN